MTTYGLNAGKIQPLLYANYSHGQQRAVCTMFVVFKTNPIPVLEEKHKEFPVPRAPLL